MQTDRLEPALRLLVDVAISPSGLLLADSGSLLVDVAATMELGRFR